MDVMFNFSLAHDELPVSQLSFSVVINGYVIYLQ